MFFLKKKLFLTLAHQNNLNILNILNLKKKIKIFLENLTSTKFQKCYNPWHCFGPVKKITKKHEGRHI